MIQYEDGNLTRENFHKLAISGYVFIFLEILGGIILVYTYGETWWLYIGLIVLYGSGALYQNVLFCSYKGYKKKMQERDSEDEIK